MFSSINKTFGCCSKIFGCSKKKIVVLNFVAVTKPFYPCETDSKFDSYFYVHVSVLTKAK